MSAATRCELCDLVGAKAAGAGAPLYRDARLSVVAVDDAAYPGFCRVVWHAHVKEMSDLAAPERAALMEAVWQVEQALREVMAPDKINIASLGNMTPHLHWHVIPRFADDAHFPSPVWAVAVRATSQSVLAARRALQAQLGEAVKRRLQANPT